ncbi:LamG-like jellyroll fold domain-containing protein [Ferruginibacter sp.]|nr:T9SS type A sorting domain-containing protein [Ferruginibacter sp.]
MKKILLLSIAFFAVIIINAQPTAGLVGHFKLDGNLTNSGLASMSATAFNTSYTANAAGATNKAMQFAGTLTSYVSITDNANLDFAGDFSFAFGVYMANNTSSQGFYDNGLNYGGCGVWFFSSDNTLRFNFKNGSIGAVGAIPINQWKAVCAVRSGSTLRLYVNGVQVTTGTEGASAITYPYAPVLGQMFFAGGGGNYNPIVNGSKMDEVRLYNRALSAAEVAQLVGYSLPLKMGEFTAAKKSTGIELSWETLSEQNTAYFDVERSANGTNFTANGKVTAKGNSVNKQGYTYTDNNPLPGVNYYRLKLADMDNSYTYSRTIAVKNNNQLISMELFPNPVSSTLQVQLPSKQKETVNIFIADATGKIIYSKQMQLSEGNNAISIPVLHLPTGVYQFTFENTEGRQTKTFIKQ